MRKQRDMSQYAYLVILALLGAGSGAAVVYRANLMMPPHWLLLCGIMIAYVLSEYYGIAIETATPGSFYELTVTGASVIFAFMITGAWGLLPILSGSLIVRSMQRQWEQPLGYLYNLTHRATGYCLLLAFDVTLGVLGPTLSQGSLTLGRIIGIMVLYLIWDTFFFSLLISIGSRQPVRAVFQQKLAPTVWIDLIPIIMGALAAIIFASNPLLIVLVILPLFLAYRAMAAVVQRLALTTALREANAQLAQLNASLEQRVIERTTDLQSALRAKDDFVSVVTHELRTPLTSIIGALGMLVDMLSETLSPRALRMLTIAHTSAERLARLINNILDLQKFDARRMPLDLQPVDVTALVDHAIELNSGFATTYEVTITAYHRAQGWFVLADTDQLIQVLTNLLSNACKFAPVHSQVTVVVAAIEQRVHISVTDHGPGIPDAFQPHVFEKFSQADRSTNRRHGGSGLGLSITKAIIDALDGTIGFVSAPEVGTTFFFELSGSSNRALHGLIQPVRLADQLGVDE